LVSPGQNDLVPEARVRLCERLAELVGPGEIPRLAEALTHPSFANETTTPDNQRLEFLGDAVLGLSVTEALVHDHPSEGEGVLTRMRAALVNADALAAWGRSIDLGASLSMGRGAHASAERDKTNVLADAVEALLAAVYLAHGIGPAGRLVREIMRHGHSPGAELAGLDPKSALQERVQADGEPSPKYRVVESTGPAHEPMFVVEVCVGERVVGRGEGRSKRLAERAAAEAALVTERAVKATEP
jgi:ribonuclease III